MKITHVTKPIFKRLCGDVQKKMSVGQKKAATTINGSTETAGGIGWTEGIMG